MSNNSKTFTYQPQVVIVGEKWRPTAFLAYFNSIKFQFDNFLCALDCTFKAIFVFNYKYSEESAPIWQFIQNAFYEMKLKTDRNISSVKSALAAMK